MKNASKKPLQKFIEQRQEREKAIQLMEFFINHGPVTIDIPGGDTLRVSVDRKNKSVKVEKL